MSDDALRKFVLDRYADQDMNHEDFRVAAYTLALEDDASIADELESAANCGLPPDQKSGTRFEHRLRIAINDAVSALRQRDRKGEAAPPTTLALLNAKEIERQRCISLVMQMSEGLYGDPSLQASNERAVLSRVTAALGKPAP